MIGDSSETSLLARIAELEEEVRALKAKLAARDLAATVRDDAGQADARHNVTADGTRGMERGVSRGDSRSSRRGGATG